MTAIERFFREVDMAAEAAVDRLPGPWTPGYWLIAALATAILTAVVRAWFNVVARQSEQVKPHLPATAAETAHALAVTPDDDLEDTQAMGIGYARVVSPLDRRIDPWELEERSVPIFGRVVKGAALNRGLTSLGGNGAVRFDPARPDGGTR